MTIVDFIESNKLNFTRVNITGVDVDGKKIYKGNVQHKGIKTMSFEECKKLNESITDFNQYYINLDKMKNIIIFDTDTEICYDIVKKFLKENDIYDSDYITPSYKCRSKNLKYKKHFWFRMDVSKKFEDIRRQKYILKDDDNEDIGDLFMSEGVIGEFKDIEMDCDTLPTISRPLFDELTKLLHVSFKESVEKEKVKKEKVKKETKIETEVEVNIKKSKGTEKIENEFCLIKKLLDILDPSYYNDYDKWYKIGLILYNYGKNINLSTFDIYNDFSKKSKKYSLDGVNKIYNFCENYDIKMTIGSLHYYAKESNLSLYNQIMREYMEATNVSICEKYICTTVKELAGNLFFYKNKILYSYDINKKFWYEEITEVLKNFIMNEVQEYLSNFVKDKKKEMDLLKKLCGTAIGLDGVIKIFRILYFNESCDVDFDTKYYLFGFDNGVIDLRTGIFRDYEYSDYMTTKTGYAYIKSNKDDQDLLMSIMNKIEPEKDKQNLLFEILASALLGKSPQKFILFSGKGGNGKSTINKLMEKALGDYYYCGKISTLCEKEATGATPEIANMNKKRYIKFSEPENSQKINNGTMKKLTGDSSVNSRQLFSNKTETILHGTIILECNKKITLADSPTEGEIRRLIDYSFQSKFTDDITKIDHSKRIFEANKYYESDAFFIKMKYSFIDLLVERAQVFLLNKEWFNIPQSVINTTQEYINNNYVILEILDDLTDHTNNNDDHIKICDLYDVLKSSDVYNNLPKIQKRELNKKNIIEFFEKNNKTKNSFTEHLYFKIDDTKFHHSNVLLGYKFKN